MLPKAPREAPTHTHPGRAIERELDSRPFEVATALGRSAAERFNEVEAWQTEHASPPARRSSDGEAADFVRFSWGEW